MADHVAASEAELTEMRELSEAELEAIAGGSGYLIGQGRSGDNG